MHHGHGLFFVSTKPLMKLTLTQNHGRSLFVTRSVKLLHHWVMVCIDSEHGKAGDKFTTAWVGPGIPQARNAKRLMACQLYFPALSFARCIVWLVKIVEQRDGISSLFPRFFVAWLAAHGFTSGVVGVSADLVVFGPRRNEAKSCQPTGCSARLMALHHDGRHIAWIGL